MILVDTSAWVEYLRGTESKAHQQLRELAADDARIVTTDVVIMEVLAGATSDEHRAQLRRMLMRYEHVPVAGLADFEAAADLYRHCRRGGETVRVLADCLIAAVAIRTGAAVLHRNQDFEVLARHTSLQITP